MTRSDRLQRLADRRRGAYAKDGKVLLEKADSQALGTEKFAALPEAEPIKYAIGAMQSVDAGYTAVSKAEADRVVVALTDGFDGHTQITCETQGSVPLDVHVRGNSDVDLLLLHAGFVTVEPGIDWGRYNYVNSSNFPLPIKALQELRTKAVSILETRYWGAKVDSTGSKAIALSGGAFKRKVDVVPSHWHDTQKWLDTRDQAYRYVNILDNDRGVTVDNRPFLHIKTVKDKCTAVGGSLRKVVRLLKNLKYDSDQDIQLSSYDITSTAYHMAPAALTRGSALDLQLLGTARDHLGVVIENDSYRDSLFVPDGSRKIFDSANKMSHLIMLHRELSALIEQVLNALNPYGQRPSRIDSLQKPIHL